MTEILDEFDRKHLLENLTPLLAEGEQVVFTCYAEHDHPVVVTTQRLILVHGIVRDWFEQRENTPRVDVHWLAEVVGFEMQVTGATWREHLRRSGRSLDRQPSQITLRLAHADPVDLTVEGLDTAVELQRAITRHRR